jgi:DNA-binding Xre family transcriptional regulator
VTKQDLVAAAHINTAVVSKLTKGENVQTNVLVKICKAFNCDLADIMEAIPDAPKNPEAKK